jgi:hypothetical protein
MLYLSNSFCSPLQSVRVRFAKRRKEIKEEKNGGGGEVG